MRTDTTVNGGQPFYYQQDRNHNVTHLTNASGAVIETYKYDAFGKPTIYAPNGTERATSLFKNRFLFTGREYAATFGFYEYRARAYNPTLGRFMSEDPKGFDAGDYNLFRYCHNDPLDLTDPMGLDPVRNPDGTYSHVLRQDVDINKIIGRYVVDSGGRPVQCASAAQYLTGTRDTQGRVHDAPPARNKGWIQGAPVTKNTPDGTLVARRWENGHYPNKGINDYDPKAVQRDPSIINHAGTKQGWDDKANKAIILDQWQGTGGNGALQKRPYDPKQENWSVVNTKTASDPKPSTSTLDDAKEVENRQGPIPDVSMLGGGGPGLFFGSPNVVPRD
jgi:RHS repeat-associated protein